MEGNNNDPEIARYRDIFLNAEKERLEELMQNPRVAELKRKLTKKYKAKELMVLAKKLINSIENGEVPEAQLESIETEIIVILSAIEDFERDDLEKERLFEAEEKTKKKNYYEKDER